MVIASSQSQSPDQPPGQPPSQPTFDPHRPEINQLRDCDRAAHDWYRFVLSFPAHIVQDYLGKFSIGSDQRLLDPFCGTGTTVVECKKLGIPSVGVEANQMAWFAGSVKLDWTPEPNGLLEQAHQIAEQTENLIRQAADTLRELPGDSFKLLLKNSISPKPLHKILILRDCLDHQVDLGYHRHLKLALARTIVSDVSNLHFGPEVGIGKAKEDAPVITAWLARVQSMATDLEYLQTLPQVPATVHHADSREILQVLAPNSIDAVITSPPYPNEKDYTRTTRLESVLLGFLKNRADLRALKQGLVRSNSRNVYVSDRDDQWVALHPEVQRIAQEIETRRVELGKTSGFERLYSRAAKLYFGGMAKHLADLRPLLRPGAQLAYVVGDQRSYLRVMIRTGEILASIAEGLGYEVVNIDLFRTRLATVTQEQMREEVIVLRWSGQIPTHYPFSERQPTRSTFLRKG
jgi:DNA methylase